LYVPEASVYAKNIVEIATSGKRRRENKLRWLALWHRYSHRGVGLRIISFKCLRTVPSLQ